MAIKDIKNLGASVTHYDVKLNTLIEKAKAKGRISTISNPPIIIKKNECN